jgi:hypothetical protein
VRPRPRCLITKKGLDMSTADTVRDLALSLARAGLERAEAVQELESASGGRRVAVVRARQMMVSSVEDESAQPDTAEAIALLDDLLVRLPT